MCGGKIRLVFGFLFLLFSLAHADRAAAVETASGAKASSTKGPKLGQEVVRKLRVGIRIKAGGACNGVYATAPVPMNWPEQEVRIVDEDVSKSVASVEYRVLEDSVKQMRVSIPRLRSGEEAHALVTFEVRGHMLDGPPDASIFVIPEKLPKAFRKFVAASPGIETRNRKVQDAAQEAIKEKTTTWEQVEAIYDFVRQKVQFRESELQGAVETLAKGTGDCEAMTSLFIAMCRAAKVPARVVWVTDHCYPEFYLEDDEGNGHWFPCQVAGTKAFGGMPDVRPILQKGDNIIIPEKKKGQRYASTYLNVKAVKGANPTVTEVMEFVAAD